MKRRWILASRSPRRKQLLGRMLPVFECADAAVDEALQHPTGPSELALFNARLKAEAVGQQHPESWILGADTVVAVDGHCLPKAANEDEVCDFIEQLQGRNHEVWTGIALHQAATRQLLLQATCSQVRFFPLTTGEIRHYAETCKPFDYAGAYAIQNLLGTLVAGYEGSYTNIVGLPLETLSSMIASIEGERPAVGHQLIHLPDPIS
jgi:septum formation protein